MTLKRKLGLYLEINIRRKSRLCSEHTGFFVCLPISTEARAIEKIRVSYFHIAYSLTLAIKKVLKEERKMSRRNLKNLDWQCNEFF